MLQIETGALRKMRADLAADGTVNYRMVLGEQEVELNSLIGKHLTLHFSGHIDCQHCGRKKAIHRAIVFLACKSLHSVTCVS